MKPSTILVVNHHQIIRPQPIGTLRIQFRIAVNLGGLDQTPHTIKLKRDLLLRWNLSIWRCDDTRILVQLKADAPVRLKYTARVLDVPIDQRNHTAPIYGTKSLILACRAFCDADIFAFVSSDAGLR